MIYHSSHAIKNQQAETKLPHRNTIFFLLCLLFCFFNIAHAKQINFETRLKNYLEKEIGRYLKQYGSTNQRYSIDLFIPKGSQGLSCDALSISRSKPASPPAGRVRLSVSCDSPSWQFRASAKIDLWMDLIIAKRDLQRGEILTTDLLAKRQLNIANFRHGMELNIDPLIGMQVRRDINSGDVINRRLLEKSYLVNRDQHIELQVTTDTFSARVTAISLEDGQLGQRVKVKNLSSGKIIEGKVIAKGTVKTSL
ncbi:flagellar basal body P-ring formation chaperone FlgA [Pseudoalteromonas shioyasakiensis]|uniref:flagellar basal body P-ring formation chaperone FlgA n=1 Tax=Pseudoalteromonas shioyasakiensis TaxID=1190813 RepID=UPI002119B253|nr:flagellar basal body P-ring formation chaperone FlgA [Pseudoalteromonas shioyasakiensis]MCQ8877520.1 flagellar basal body P-ring formation chaperone FlgA [Pseudoalteromonas shioyasakiensis]